MKVTESIAKQTKQRVKVRTKGRCVEVTECITVDETESKGMFKKYVYESNRKYRKVDETESKGKFNK